MNRLPAILIATLAILICTATARGQTSACAADVDGNGVVAATDIAQVLSSWGACVGCAADVNADNSVNSVDLASVLSLWGGTCAPSISSASPTAGPLTGGTSVTILGDHLVAPVGVTFGGSSATIVSSTRNSVTLLTPARRAGAATVVVTTQGGSATAGTYVYYGAPMITGVAPSSGPAAGGSVVTISGTAFYGTPSVSFGGVPASSVSLISQTQLTAVAPSGTGGSTVAISVSTNSGLATMASAFTYLAINVPAWATLLEALPDPSVVTSATLRNAIIATGRPWRVRDNGTQIEMVLIPPGSFAMGCSASNQFPCEQHEIPVHSVTLTSAFYLGRYEVTQAQWTARMGTNPSYWQDPSTQVPLAQVPNRPVDQVSWNTVQSFLTATGMRLPTEAEWEYAYRAGTTTAFHGFSGFPFGTNDDALVGTIGWFDGNAVNQPRPVGLKAANGFGLHDMAGNVWEWLSDWYAFNYYGSSPATNPTGPITGTNRVLRGGSYVNLYSEYLRASARNRDTAGLGLNYYGFRVARNP
jgi:formylglycine-generating enzyme required for sulfatase activity